MSETETPIEVELIRSALAVDVRVLGTRVEPTSDDDVFMVIDGRLGSEDEDDVEWAAFGVVYTLSALSFTGARPRGMSEMHFEVLDDWRANDMLRRLSYEKGELCFYADYVRGRMMKTSITVRNDGTFRLEATNRGEAATRWVARLQGKKPLRVVTE